MNYAKLKNGQQAIICNSKLHNGRKLTKNHTMASIDGGAFQPLKLTKIKEESNLPFKN